MKTGKNKTLLANLNNKRELGNYFEQAACRYLQKQGLILVEQNFNARVGELDLIMLAPNEQQNFINENLQILVFIEVRYRKNKNYGGALQSISPAKIKKLIKTAQYFLLTHSEFKNHHSRFDVIAIEKIIQKFKIKWVKQAFTI